jgi:hypothetical protein
MEVVLENLHRGNFAALKNIFSIYVDFYEPPPGVGERI